MRRPERPRLYIRTRPIRQQQVDDVLFLIDEEGKAIHALDPIGAGLWTLLSEPVSMAEAKSIFRQAFPGISARKIAADLDRLLGDLVDFGLVEARSQ